MNKLTRLLLHLLVFCSITINAQEYSSDKQKQVVNKVIKALNQHYIFPEVAQQTADFLSEQLNKEKYLNYNNTESFVFKLTQDIQKISHDDQLRVRVRSSNNTTRNDINYFGINKSEILAGNIGYLRFDDFSSDEQAKVIFKNAFEQLNGSDALIIDLRNNGGGSPELAQYISSFLLKEKTQLSSIKWRSGKELTTAEYWTEKVSSTNKLTSPPLYILTSPLTFSAAEALSYDLQTYQRATIIGETTKGGANPGKTFPLDENIEIFISTGSAVNPITHSNWQGTGVKPNEEINSLYALELALELASEAAIQHRIKQGKATTKEFYRKPISAPIYGKWTLAKQGCPLKIRTAQAQLNTETLKYQTPYKIKYYGNGDIRISYDLGTKYSVMHQTVYFKDRNEEKSGVSIGFKTPEAITITNCKF